MRRAVILSYLALGAVAYALLLRTLPLPLAAVGPAPALAFDQARAYALVQRLAREFPRRDGACRGSRVLRRCLFVDRHEHVHALRAARLDRAGEADIGQSATNEVRDLNRAVQREVISTATLESLQEPLIFLFLATGLYVAVEIMAMPLADVMILVFLCARVLGGMGKVQKEYQRMAVRAEAVKMMKDFQMGPLFLPPLHRTNDLGFKGSMNCPGANGGTNIPGGSVVDPETNILYVATIKSCTAFSLIPGKDAPPAMHKTGTTIADWASGRGVGVRGNSLVENVYGSSTKSPSIASSSCRSINDNSTSDVRWNSGSPRSECKVVLATCLPL